MTRIFLSHSSKDNAQARALRQWLIDQRPELVDEIFLDIAEDTGLASGQPLTGHTSVVCDVAFSPDGTRVASSSYDGTVRIWDGQDHTVRLWDAVNRCATGVMVGPDLPIP